VDPRRVLVTDAGYKHSVGMIRSLGRSGHRVCAVSHNRWAPGFFSRHTRAHAVVPNPAADADVYVNELIRWGQRWETQVLVPVGYASCAAVARHRDCLTTAGLRTVGPKLESFQSCADKWTIVQAARPLGIRIPQTILVTSETEIDAFVSGHVQAIAKYRHESAGTGVVYLRSNADWRAELRRLPMASREDGSPNLIAQEYIDGVAHGYMALAWHGRIVREFAHQRLREWPVAGGAATAAISVDDPDLIDAGRRLITAVGWHGPAMIEFRSNESGHYLIEFNPKFWGSLELALDCGADFAADYCALASGDELSGRTMPTYRVGQRYWWPWRGDWRRLWHRPSDAGRVVRDLVSPSTHSNWSWRDPTPNLIEIGAEFTYPIRRHA